jgi:signal transduction histidine kinase
LALGACAILLSALAGGVPWWEDVLGAAVVLISLFLGVSIDLRRPRHPIAGLLLANAGVVALAGFAEAYARYAVLENPGGLPGAAWAVLWDQSAWAFLFAPVVAIALVFPDGRLPSPRWRLVAACFAATVVAALLLSAFEPEPFDAPYDRVDNPLPGIDGIGWLWPLVMVGGIFSLIAAVQAVRLRFRRSSGAERLQLKWLVYSASLIPVTLIVCLAFALSGKAIDDTDAFVALMLVMLGGVPAAVGIAVLRYRLYDIDRLINRTLVYGVLSVLLAGTYAGAALLLGTALGAGSSWATAGATLLVAVAFRPVRARVQDAVDRRFSRARYDGLRRISDFLDQLRAGRASPESVEPLLREILGDKRLELRYWLPESQIFVDAHGRTAAGDPRDSRLQTPVTRAGAALALVLHEPVSADRARLLEETVAAAGLAIEIVRLRVELRRHLEEVEASRARILAAGYAERRRIERDLHDGAQQRLVSIGLALRHAEHELGTDRAARVLDDAVAEIGVAIEELRELAGGVRPTQLDGGLAPALRELAARAPLPVEIETNGARLGEDLEAAAYFIASEGLTNAVKHAQASHVTVRAEHDGDRLIVSVSDDGVGGAAPRAGSGIRGLADRVEAHGGTLRVESVKGQGTTLVAELPCES